MASSSGSCSRGRPLARQRDFSLEGHYIAEFRKQLEREGVDPGGFEEVVFPIHREKDLIGEGLYVPTLPDGPSLVDEVRSASSWTRARTCG